MSDDDARPVRSISGGSLQEAELGAARRVAWTAKRDRADSPFAQGVRRLRRSTTALVGAFIVALLLVVALFADVLAPQSPIASDQSHTFERPSWSHPLGTDQLGRDMLSRVIHGSRISLAVGVSSVLLALFVGVPFGMIAGYYGGRADTLIMRTMDLILAFPIYLLAIILMIIFAPTAGLIGTMKVTGAIAIVRIPIYARLVRQRAIDHGEGVHRGMPRRRRARSVDPRAPRPAKLPGADHRDDDARHRDLDHRGGDAVVPRARHAAADAELGLGPEGQCGVHSIQSLDLALPRSRDLRHRARLQPLR